MSEHAPAITNRITGARRPAVAIVGFTDHRAQAPIGDPRFEIWGLNELYRYMPLAAPDGTLLFHRWFELHNRSDFEKPADQGGDPEHLKALAGFPIPVYMQQRHEDIKASMALPKAFIESRTTTYMTSSIAWMIGLAVAEGFEEIHLYGVDMAQDTEYQEQRPCVEYLIGLAQGRGIKCFVPPTSDLLKAVGQYGFESQGSAFVLKLVERYNWLQQQHTMWQAKEAELDAEYESKAAGLRKQYEDRKRQFITNRQQVEGAIDDCRYWKRSWGMQPAGGVTPATPDRSKNPNISVSPAEKAALARQPAAMPVFDGSRALALVGTPGSDGPTAKD